MIKKLISLKVYEVSSGYIEFTSTIIFRYMQKQLQEVFYAKDVLEIWQNSQENSCSIDYFLIKLQASFFTEHLGWLLLYIFKKTVLKDFLKFTGKQQCQSFFFY